MRKLMINVLSAIFLALSYFSAPMYCPTKAKPAVANPLLRAMRVPIIGQLVLRAARASLPSLPSQKMSVML
jgi:hypothetical protein